MTDQAPFEQLGKDIDRIVELFGKIKSLAKREPNEPRIKVSPYAKFDKYHKKKRK